MSLLVSVEVPPLLPLPARRDNKEARLQLQLAVVKQLPEWAIVVGQILHKFEGHCHPIVKRHGI